MVLYFYPKDNTPGCSRQACAFAGSYVAFKEQNVVVIGVSKDSVSSHMKFTQKYELPFISKSRDHTRFGITHIIMTAQSPLHQTTLNYSPLRPTTPPSLSRRFSLKTAI